MTNPHEEIEESALALAQELAREAIELARGGSTIVNRKANVFDVVTAADLAIEARFRERIAERFPDHAILGEEQGLDAAGREWTWVVDPIDGTFNYAIGLPGAGSAIALMREGETRVGVIADFAADTVFSCRKGAGATSDRGVLPADTDPVSELGRACLYIDPGHQSPDPTMYGVIQTIAEIQPLVPRLTGSAAVSLAAVAFSGGCLVAAGLETWDAAAGALLAEERGRTVVWWKYAGDSFHHVLAGGTDIVRAIQPAMPDFIGAWLRKAGSRASGNSQAELLGPSATIFF